MHDGKYKYEAPQQPMGGEPGNAATRSILEDDDKVYEQVEQEVRDVHGKTTQSVVDVYKQVMSSISKNPGKTILFSFVIGVGLVFVFRSYVQAHTGRFTRPMVKAFSALLASFSVKMLSYLKKQYNILRKVRSLKEIEDRYA